MPDTAIIAAGLFILGGLVFVASSLQMIAHAIKDQHEKSLMTTEEYMDLCRKSLGTTPREFK